MKITEKILRDEGGEIEITELYFNRGSKSIRVFVLPKHDYDVDSDSMRTYPFMHKLGIGDEGDEALIAADYETYVGKIEECTDGGYILYDWELNPMGIILEVTDVEFIWK